MACSKSTQLGILPPTSEFINFWPIKIIYCFTANHSAPRVSLGLMCLSLHSGVSLWRWQLAKIHSGSNASSAINDRGLQSKNISQPPLFKVKSFPGSPKSGNASLAVKIMTPCGRKKDQLERYAISTGRKKDQLERLSGVRGNSLVFCRGWLRNINAIFNWSF
jgi:hypothetical protein